MGQGNLYEDSETYSVSGRECLTYILRVPESRVYLDLG
jgi:hypothetical protein